MPAPFWLKDPQPDAGNRQISLLKVGIKTYANPICFSQADADDFRAQIAKHADAEPPADRNLSGRRLGSCAR